MPATSLDLDAAKTRLLERRDALRAQIGDVDAELADRPGDQVEDNGEVAEQRTRHAVRHGESDRDVAELRDVDEALTLLDLGVYGTCIDCGLDIAPARLQALPSALRCIACQEIFDRSHETRARAAPP